MPLGPSGPTRASVQRRSAPERVNASSQMATREPPALTVLAMPRMLSPVVAVPIINLAFFHEPTLIFFYMCKNSKLT